MFEKEAEEYARQSCFTEMSNPSLSESIDISDDIKEAVMFGYNKAKEEMQEQGLALQSDMDKTIEQNIALKKELNKAKKVQVVEHFEAYGQCRDSRRIAALEAENEKLKEQNYKTKVALRNVVDYLGQFCSDYPDCVIEAEQFLKETANIREDSTLDGDWVVDEINEFLKEIKE